MRLRHVFVLRAILTASAATALSAGSATAEGSQRLGTAFLDCLVFLWPSEEQNEIVDVVVPFVTSLLETAE